MASPIEAPTKVRFVLLIKHYVMFFFIYVLLTVHLSIFMLVINQLDAQNLFYTYRCDDTRGCVIQFLTS